MELYGVNNRVNLFVIHFLIIKTWFKITFNFALLIFLVVLTFLFLTACKSNSTKKQAYFGKSIIQPYFDRELLIKRHIEKEKGLKIEFKKRFHGNDTLVSVQFSFKMKRNAVCDSGFIFFIEPYTKNIIDFVRIDDQNFVLKIDPSNKDTIYSYFLEMYSDKYIFYQKYDNDETEFSHKVFLFNLSHM